MAEISIPFCPEMAYASVKGTKTKTSRNRSYGGPGDTFSVGTHRFELVCVEEHPLGMVANVFFGEEGFATPAAFIAVWDRLHPRKRYDPDQLVWVHTYRMLKDDAIEHPNEVPA